MKNNRYTTKWREYIDIIKVFAENKYKDNVIVKFLKREKYIWDNNEQEIEAVNKEIANLLLTIIFIGTIILGIVCIMDEGITLLSSPFYLLFIFSIIARWIICSDSRYISYVTTLYMIHTVIFFVALYGACIVVPNGVSALILGFIFVFPLTVFDKVIRVNLTMLGFWIIYLLLATPIKSPDIRFMDLLNVTGFCMVALVLSGYLRQLHLENIDLKRQSREREVTDALTGLFNRAKLSEISHDGTIKSEIFGVIMMDIDYFKYYNDTYGHQQGDICLKTIAKVLDKVSNIYNVSFYRYGGEEFLGIVWNGETERVYNICNAVAQNISDMNMPHKESPLGRVTISAGFSKQCPRDKMTLERLISQADYALYKSKDKGRNKITSY